MTSPVDYPQNVYKTKLIESFFKMIGKEEWFTSFIDVLFFVVYREYSRNIAEKASDKTFPVGSRFYFEKNKHILGVKEDYEKNGLFKKLMERLKLGIAEDPVQIQALKVWDKEEFIQSFLSPSQFQYLTLIEKLYPEILVEIKNVPKVAIFGQDDKLLKFRKREVDILKVFERLGNIRVVVLKGIAHDLDFGGNKHNLYINPIFAKYVYDFFLQLAQT